MVFLPHVQEWAYNKFQVLFVQEQGQHRMVQLHCMQEQACNKQQVLYVMEQVQVSCRQTLVHEQLQVLYVQEQAYSRFHAPCRQDQACKIVWGLRAQEWAYSMCQVSDGQSCLNEI